MLHAPVRGPVLASTPAAMPLVRATRMEVLGAGAGACLVETGAECGELGSHGGAEEGAPDRLHVGPPVAPVHTHVPPARHQLHLPRVPPPHTRPARHAG
jgi:hypothetical protein